MADIPTDEVIKLKKVGKSNDEINTELQEEGFSLAQISEAITQASIKRGVEGMPDERSASRRKLGMESSMLDEEPKEEEEIPIPIPTPSKEPSKVEQEEQPSPVKVGQSAFIPTVSKPIVEDIQALVEEIISEKWGEVVSSIGDINIWRAKITDDIESVKQEVLRTEGRLENIQTAVLGKVKEYDKDIREVTSEMKALEKVFEKIMEPLVTNIKELSRITEELKRKR